MKTPIHLFRTLRVRILTRYGGGLSMEPKCSKNPNDRLIREIIAEDLPLLKMLATNGKDKSLVKK